MSKLNNPNLPTLNSPDYDRLLNVKLNEYFRSIREAHNRLVDGYLFPSVTVTTDYTMNLNDSLILANAVSNKIDVTLESAGQWKDKRITVKKIDASANTVKAIGTIDGATDWITTTQYASQEFESDGTNIWKV